MKFTTIFFFLIEIRSNKCIYIYIFLARNPYNPVIIVQEAKKSMSGYIEKFQRRKSQRKLKINGLSLSLSLSFNLVTVTMRIQKWRDRI